MVGAGSSRRGGSEAGEEGEGASGLWLVGGASNVGCAVLRTEGFLVSVATVALTEHGEGVV